MAADDGPNDASVDAPQVAQAVAADDGPLLPKADATQPMTPADSDDRGRREGWEPFVVGEPGRAATTVVPGPDLAVPERPDTVLDGYAVATPTGGAVEVRAASVRGLAHRYYGRVRQDSYTVRVAGDGRWLVVVVADGVSAGIHSHVAADAATTEGGRDLARLLEDVPVEQIDWASFLARTATAVADAVARHTRALGEPAPPDGDVAALGATTMTTALVPLGADEHGRRCAHLLGVGDSSAWVLAQGAWRCVLGGKDDGVYASAATAALPHLPPVPPAPVRVDLGRDELLVLVSDGVGDPLADGQGEVGAFFAQHWSVPPPLLAFAGQVDFVRRSYDDDRTAAALWTGS